ncbi:hypothetical protein [Actinophytocola sp.]|uniref:hypothetical protein n=1 Tax=Actinophytocola sp. TaxID=1872138 RepID=UPI002ED58549
MYQDAVQQLHTAADRVAEYRSELVAFADLLGAKKWDAEVTGPIGDAYGRLTKIEGLYRDLAVEMERQGDQGAAAYEQAPWVPGNLLAGEGVSATVAPAEAPVASVAPDEPESDDELDSIDMAPAGGGDLRCVLCATAAYVGARVDGNTVEVRLALDELRDVHEALTRTLLDGGIGVWTVARGGGEVRVTLFAAEGEAELEVADDEGSIVTVLTMTEVRDLHLRLTRMVLRANGAKV